MQIIKDNWISVFPEIIYVLEWALRLSLKLQICTSLARFLLVPIVFIHILCSVLYYGHFTCSKIQKKKIKEMLVGMLQADT